MTSVARLETGELHRTSQAIDAIVCAPDGRKVWFAAGQTVHQLDMVAQQVSTWTEVQHRVTSLAVKPDGQALCLGLENGSLVFGAADGLTTVATHLGPASSVAWSPDGRHLAAGHPGGWVTLVEVDRGAVVELLDPPMVSEAGRTSVVFAPSSARLVTTTGNGLFVWSTAIHPKVRAAAKQGSHRFAHLERAHGEVKHRVISSWTLERAAYLHDLATFPGHQTVALVDVEDEGEEGEASSLSVWSLARAKVKSEARVAGTARCAIWADARRVALGTRQGRLGVWSTVPAGSKQQDLAIGQALAAAELGAEITALAYFPRGGFFFHGLADGQLAVAELP